VAEGGVGRLRPVLGASWAGSRLAGPVKGVGSLVALYIALSLILHDNRPPLGEFVFGALIGLLYALLAFGLILVYRANRIINFAQAEMGSVAALLGVLLIKVDHVPYLLAFVIAIVAAALSGLVVELVVVRRFARAPRLVLSVATIGVALLFALVQFYLPHWMGAGFVVSPTPPKTPFSALHFTIKPLIFDANSIVILFAALLVVAGLTFFFKRTDTGMAVRASAENADRARLLGISVNRISTVVWVLAAILSGLGVFLRIPVIGLPIGADIGPEVLLYALAAAVIARMESFPVALVAGVAIGVTEQCLYYFSHDSGLAEAVMLPVLLVAMLAQRVRISRGQDTGLATWALSSEFRPIPPELRELPEVAWARFAGSAAILGLVIALPYMVGLKQQILSSVVVCYAIVAVSLVILTGWAGQISLGQWGFAGIGAAVASGVAIHLRDSVVKGDFFVALILAGLVGAVVSVVIGLPALRIQGLYLAVTTLSFALAVQVFVLSPTYFPWLLPVGLAQIERPYLYGHFSLAGPRAFYYMCLVILGLCLVSAKALRSSRAGRVMIATRDNERGAASYAISVRMARLSAFAIAGFWASVAGALFAYQEKGVNNNSYGLSLSLQLLTIVVIGGLTSLPGAMLAALFIGGLQYGNFSPQIQSLASGVGVLVLLILVPGGLAQIVYSGRDSLLRFVADRRGIVVPSLLADVRSEEDEGAAGAMELAEAEALSQAMLAVGRSADGAAPSEKEEVGAP
jgi:branched-chain amino acid transport system permease protein